MEESRAGSERAHLGPRELPGSARGYVDVQHHMSSPAYEAHLADSGYESTRPSKEAWSPVRALEAMDSLGIEAAVLSLPKPGVHLGDTAKARTAARSSNEFAATVRDDYPRRFGWFATLTLPDVAGSVDEAEYALDVLGADGVLMLTNAHGVYAGDPELDPLMSVLDERHAVVFVHPTDLPSGSPLHPGIPMQGTPAYLVDFMLDTTRAAVSLLRHRITSRFPNVRIILAHAGGFLPFVADRVAQLSSFALPDLPLGPDEILAELGSLYFDVALSTSRWALPPLLSFARPDRILFGSDYPAIPASMVEHFMKNLDLSGHDVSPRMAEGIRYQNASVLFPRLVAAPDAG